MFQNMPLTLPPRLILTDGGARVRVLPSLRALLRSADRCQRDATFFLSCEDGNVFVYSNPNHKHKSSNSNSIQLDLQIRV